MPSTESCMLSWHRASALSEQGQSLVPPRILTEIETTMAAVEAQGRTGTSGVKKHRFRATGGHGFSWHHIKEQFTWWEITIFVIGVISLVTVLSALFFAVGDRPTTITIDEPAPPVDSLEFATALSALVDAPIDRGGTVTVLNNGDEFLPALLDGIRSAK